MLWVNSNRAHEIHIKLHRKYGHTTRFGPNMVSVSDPKEINTIYSFKKPWPNPDFYRALLLKNSTKPVESIFPIRNEAIHYRLKRPIANVYSMNNLLSFEPYVDTGLNPKGSLHDVRESGCEPCSHVDKHSQKRVFGYGVGMRMEGLGSYQKDAPTCTPHRQPEIRVILLTNQGNAILRLGLILRKPQYLWLQYV
ncbi:hypothetical protein DM02DRAFT_652151 [Periconia macrospinosa]|uniref:Uncharacterized protein n=1 Tax=Periconia macrospinosa TaxID=97972 RepID=A0A2V1E0U8_9PLEO|nr:hypothetical protein DM02DRAFT_652151 [Periconia macrospinosa]